MVGPVGVTRVLQVIHWAKPNLKATEGLHRRAKSCLTRPPMDMAPSKESNIFCYLLNSCRSTFDPYRCP